MYIRQLFLVISCLFLTSFVSIAKENESRFGLDYVFPLDPKYQNKPFAKLYQDAGLKWVNFGDVRWKALEPNPPVNQIHRYKWFQLDKAVKHWQEHGFNIVFTLRTGNSWFSGSSQYTMDDEGLLIKYMVNQSDRFPKEEHIKDFKNFIASIVERYDGDGKDDMPGLLRPIYFYQIGNEYGNPAFWTGSVEEYYKLLKIASRTAKSAFPEVKIIPNGLRTNDAFHNDPYAEHLEETMMKYEEQVDDEFYVNNWKRMRDLDEGCLQLKNCFDIVDAGGNGSWYTTSEGYYNYVRNILDNAGNNHIPIWDMEARNEPLLTPLINTHIYMDLGVPNGNKLVSILKNKFHNNHKKVSEWYRAEQARLTAKVFVTKFAAGNEKVFMGMPMDWDNSLGALSWPNPFMGFISSQMEPWEAYYTLKYLIAKLDGFSSAKKQFSPEGTSLYKFTFSGKDKIIWVAWLDDERTRGVNTPIINKTIVLKGVNPQRAFEIPTKGNKSESVSFSKQGDGIEVKLSPTPLLFIK
jgi:hypothetical protein